jgi:hypothetical protein
MLGIVIIHHIKVGVVHDKLNLILGKFDHVCLHTKCICSNLETHTHKTTYRHAHTQDFTLMGLIHIPVDSLIHNPHLVIVVQQ